MLSQLHTPIPLQTPKGKAWAVAIIDYGPQWDLQWVTFIHATGECWTFRNSHIRQEQNFTFGLPQPTAIGNTITEAMRDRVGPKTDAGKVADIAPPVVQFYQELNGTKADH